MLFAPKSLRVKRCLGSNLYEMGYTFLYHKLLQGRSTPRFTFIGGLLHVLSLQICSFSPLHKRYTSAENLPGVPYSLEVLVLHSISNSTFTNQRCLICESSYLLKPTGKVHILGGQETGMVSRRYSRPGEPERF